jgi:hypothetical protein
VYKYYDAAASQGKQAVSEEANGKKKAAYTPPPYVEDKEGIKAPSRIRGPAKYPGRHLYDMTLMEG